LERERDDYKDRWETLGRVAKKKIDRLEAQHADAVEEIVWLRALLGRIAAGHAHPSKLAGEAVDESVVRLPAGGQ
jgi:hypothetical protein